MYLGILKIHKIVISGITDEKFPLPVVPVLIYLNQFLGRRRDFILLIVINQYLCLEIYKNDIFGIGHLCF